MSVQKHRCNCSAFVCSVILRICSVLPKNMLFSFLFLYSTETTPTPEASPLPLLTAKSTALWGDSCLIWLLTCQGCWVGTMPMPPTSCHKESPSFPSGRSKRCSPRETNTLGCLEPPVMVRRGYFLRAMPGHGEANHISDHPNEVRGHSSFPVVSGQRQLSGSKFHVNWGKAA